MNIITKLKTPLERQKHAAMIKKEMKKGKISLYDDDIINLLEEQPMFFFQTAADFMLMKDMLGQPAQHLATSVMALVLSDHVKKMRLVEADLNPIYPELTKDKTELEHKNRTYLEVVFPNEDEGVEESEEEIVTDVDQFIKEMKTEQWYVIDTNLGLVFERGLYLKLEDPQINSIVSGSFLQNIIDETRRIIKPASDCNSDQVLAVMCGLEKMYRSYPEHRYKDLLFSRLIRLQEIYSRKIYARR